MCLLNWELLLEYLKVLFSWPPTALIFALIFIFVFRRAIHDFLARVSEGNLFGQTFKAGPPTQQPSDPGATEGRLALAAEAHPQPSEAQQPQEPLPPELANDPLAPAAITYVRNNAAQTVIEYKRLLFSYNSERLFNRIYGTQIALLEFLASHPDEPVSLVRLVQFHQEHQHKAGSVEYQLRDYVNFLVSFRVVSVSGPDHAQEYKITQHGLEFLSYIKANYTPIWNQRAF
jgi:hypothetical protein